jgi:hypothetical protein
LSCLFQSGEAVNAGISKETVSPLPTLFASTKKLNGPKDDGDGEADEGPMLPETPYGFTPTPGISKSYHAASQ